MPQPESFSLHLGLAPVILQLQLLPADVLADGLLSVQFADHMADELVPVIGVETLEVGLVALSSPVTHFIHSQHIYTVFRLFFVL